MSQEHIVIVNFEAPEGEQAEALERIGAYIDSFLSRQPGFIESRLHKGLDGRRIINYARWETEADFQAFAEKARSHPDLPGLMKYQPSAGFFEVWNKY